MTGIDWDRDKRRQQRRELRRDGRYETVRQQEAAIRNRQQRQFLQFAGEHRHENRFCADIDRSGRVSQRQAAVLREISQENGWPIKPVTHSTSRGQRRRRAERKDPTIRPVLERARDAVIGYTGTDGWIKYLKRDFATKDPDWLPTANEAKAIMKNINGTQ